LTPQNQKALKKPSEKDRKAGWKFAAGPLRLKMTMDMTIVIHIHKQELCMQTINASVFKAKCLKLMEEVNESGEEIVILKNGKPISKLVPYKSRPRSLFGLHEGSVRSRDDLIEPVDMPWEVER
jgi:prevent-host-death family protein